MIYELIKANPVDFLIIIPLIILSIIPFIPTTYAGFNKYFYDTFTKKWTENKKLNFYELIIHLISHTLITGPALSMGFKGTVTLVLFIVLIADLYLNQKITDNAVILSIVGIAALYFEKIIDTAEEISIWKIFTWKAKKISNPRSELVIPDPPEDK